MTAPGIIRAVVAILGLATLVGLTFIGALAVQEKETPEALVAITTGALGAVAGLLARTSSDHNDGPPARELPRGGEGGDSPTSVVAD